MSFNRSLLTQITKDLNKKPSKPKVPKNQWQHPGEVTNIPSPNITMDAVSYPVLGVPNIGQPQMMFPDQDYHFPGADNVTEYPQMGKGGQHGGLDRWFAEKWVDVKTGKECGRQEGEHRAGYPACRPSKRINSDTPKTASELSPAEKAKFKREKTSSQRINYNHKKQLGGALMEYDMQDKLDQMKSGGNVPTNPSLWSRAKAAARSKYDVYPSAYANGFAAKWYKSHGGGWRKGQYGMEVMGDGGVPSNPGFNALPLAVQQKIMNNMAQGGEKMPAEIAHARFAAAGNLDQMSDYGYAYGGYIPEMSKGGYTVTRSHDRKGKTHKVTGPDGTVKYFGDSSMGQHPKDPKRKAAFYARHKHNLDHNPYFRAFARATWADGGELDMMQKAGQVRKPKNGFIDLQKEYNLDPYSEEGLAKAKELNAMFPGSKFKCEGNGCADIARRIAGSFGDRFPSANAWGYRGTIPELYVAPGYKAELDAGKPLHDPRSYAFPEEVKNMSGVLVGLNRNDNYDGHMAKNRSQANDSRDYINRMLYPGPNAMHEHIGYYNDGIMYHGTAGNAQHPAFYVLDDPKDGIALPGIARYNVVNAMDTPGFFQNAANAISSGINSLMNRKQQGGGIYDYMTSHGMNGSFANRKKLFSQYFGEGYKGTAEQNTQMLQMMQQGKFKAPSQPMMTVPYAPKPAFPGATTGLGFLNQTRAPYKPGKAPQYKAQPQVKQNPEFADIDSTVPDALRKGANAIGIPTPVSQLLLWAGSKVLGNNIGMSDKSLSPQQQEILYQTIKNARERNKKDPTKGGLAYGDYGNQGYGSPEDFNNWLVRGKQAMITDPQFLHNVTKNPVYQVATTVGRGSYKVDPNDPNIIHYTDSYDFVKHDDDELFKGATDNSYQPFRRGLSAVEDPNAEQDPNNRIHFSFNIKEMEDRLAKKKGATGMRYGGLTRFQVAGQNNAAKVSAPSPNKWFPVIDPDALSNEAFQMPNEQQIFQNATGIPYLTDIFNLANNTKSGVNTAAIQSQVKQKVAAENPGFKKQGPVPGSATNNADQNRVNLADNAMELYNTLSGLSKINSLKSREENNRQMLRSQNATWNQQYDATLNRGQYSQGPSSYGLYKPDAMFAQEGMQVPLSMDEAAKYTVDSIDATAGVNTIGVGAPTFDFSQMSQEQAQQEEQQAPQVSAPTNEPAESTASLKDTIAYRESRGNYKAFNPKGGGSGAVGKYQFRWDHNKDWIADVTGIKNKQSFLNNPEAQEKAFDYWDQNVLTPNAQKIKSQYNPNLNMNEIKMLIHFQGPTGAQRYFKTGKYTTDAEGTTPMRYLGKNIDTKQGVKAANLDSGLMAFASDMGKRFPGLTLSSGNDSSHMSGSKHYKNKAIDIGANSSNRQAYAGLAKFLAGNPSIKKQYGIEDIINEGDHLHVEMMRRGGEYELTADQIMQIKAMGGDVEFI